MISPFAYVPATRSHWLYEMESEFDSSLIDPELIDATPSESDIAPYMALAYGESA